MEDAFWIFKIIAAPDLVGRSNPDLEDNEHHPHVSATLKAVTFQLQLLFIKTSFIIINITNR